MEAPKHARRTQKQPEERIPTSTAGPHRHDAEARHQVPPGAQASSTDSAMQGLTLAAGTRRSREAALRVGQGGRATAVPPRSALHPAAPYRRGERLRGRAAAGSSEPRLENDLGEGSSSPWESSGPCGPRAESSVWPWHPRKRRAVPHVGLLAIPAMGSSEPSTEPYYKFLI